MRERKLSSYSQRLDWSSTYTLRQLSNSSHRVKKSVNWDRTLFVFYSGKVINCSAIHIAPRLSVCLDVILDVTFDCCTGAHLKDSDALLATVITHPGASEELVMLLVKQARDVNPESMVGALEQLMAELNNPQTCAVGKERLDKIGATIVNAGTPVGQQTLHQVLKCRAQHMVHAIMSNQQDLDFWEPTMQLLSDVVQRAEAVHDEREGAVTRLQEIEAARIKASKMKGERSERVMTILDREQNDLEKSLREMPPDDSLDEDNNTALALLKGIRDKGTPVPEGSNCDAEAISLALRHGNHQMLELVLQSARRGPRNQALVHIVAQILDQRSPPSPATRSYLFAILETCLQNNADPTALPAKFGTNGAGD